MKTITLIEHERLPIQRLSTETRRALERLDYTHAVKAGDTVFDWSLRSHIKARNYVGVVQAGDTAIEILPKIASQTTTMRASLAHMLSVCRWIPARERDTAATKLARQPLHELFMRMFARRLLDELRRGPTREYVVCRENSTFVRGKIDYAEHLRRNSVNRERVFVAFDDYQVDTRLNRVFRACCRSMLSHVKSYETQRCLKVAILHLADVEDRWIAPADLENITFDRRTERYRGLFDFCRMYLAGRSPTPTAGGHSTFSLLFPMERLFEEYIARIVRRHSNAAGVPRHDVHFQGRGWTRALYRETNGPQRFFLRPDLVIGSLGSPPRMVLDTKWKALARDKSAVQGVSQSDAYQLYAYARRYGSNDNVLVYPYVPGVKCRTYEIQGAPGQRLRVEFFDLGDDLPRREGDSVERLLRGGQEAPTSVDHTSPS